MELEISNILANDPLIISQKCDEIIEVFSKAKQQLISVQPPLTLDHHQHLYHQPPDMETVLGYLQRQAMKGKGKEVAEEVVVEAATKTESGGDHERQHGYGTMIMEVGGSSSSALRTSSRRSSSRNDEQGSNRRVRMAAPRIGNTEIPPEDGFTWRKYGQKEILNAKYPRSYYRCTHQKLYNCNAKKQVQRLDDDPFTFDILYREEHTCHTFNTAPSAPPPPPPQSPAVHDIFLPQAHHPITTVAPPLFHHWLPMDLPRHSHEGACTIFQPQQQQQQQEQSILCTSNPDGELSTVGSNRGGRDQAVDFLNNQPMTVDYNWSEMFNSGSSSNSMDLIFAPTPTDDKWDNKDRKD